jgi:peptidoglycan/LPS O-acetylase OafA/YrhL
MHGYMRTGIWRSPPSDFYTMIGESGVALFFAITGFLFWGKLLHVRGAPNWRHLYIGRLFRIAPVYLAVVAVMMVVVWNRSYYELHEPVSAVLSDTARWLTLGMLGQPDVNGYQNTGRLLAGVTWTLRYEWLFYFSLPFFALFARRAWHLWFASGGLLIFCVVFSIYHAREALYCALFFCGMIPASLIERGWRIQLGRTLTLVTATACLLLLFMNFSSTIGVMQVFLLGILFCLFSIGSAYGKLLEAKPVRRLGEISYSLYLIHGLVLTAVFSSDALRGYAMNSHASYWLIVALCGLLAVLAATFSYLLIERPGIRLGRTVASRFVYPRAAGDGSRP